MDPTTAWRLLLILVLTCATPPARAVLAQVVRALQRVSRVRGAGEVLVFVVVAAVGSIPTLLDAVAPPSTPDEFAYLLAGDTFAKGRLTNPRHTLWEHFETLHVLVTPTYASKYPPALGLSLALGQVLWKPIVGAWLTTALAAAATCWMLRAWVTPRWALIGGVMAGLHPQVFWSGGQTYWGASPAMLGGALLIGAAARAVNRRPRAWHGAVGALGIALLAISRAHEGLILTALVAVWVITSTTCRGKLRPLLRATALPATLALAVAGAWLGYYNWRVTLDPFELPYTLYARQYQVAPLFTWQRARPPPEYRHLRIAEYWLVYDRDEWARQAESARGFVRGAADFVRGLIHTYVAPASLWAAMLGLPFALWRRRSARVALALLALFVAIHLGTTWWKRMHYVMPAVPLFVALVVMSLHELGRLRAGRVRLGAGVASAIVLVQLAAPGWIIYRMTRATHPTGATRAGYVQRLLNTPGDHLVLVEYSDAPQHLFEWVYNDADIDASRVVFARPIDEDGRRRLLDYYPRRRAWRLYVDGANVRLDEQRR